MLRVRQMRSLQKFASVHASVCNHFNQERSLSSRANDKPARAAALVEWRGLFRSLTPRQVSEAETSSPSSDSTDLPP